MAFKITAAEKKFLLRRRRALASLTDLDAVHISALDSAINRGGWNLGLSFYRWKGTLEKHGPRLLLF